MAHPQPPRVTHFDMWTDAEYSDNPHAFYETLQGECPVAHSDANGGFWMLSRFDDITRALQDGEVFSSRHLTLTEADESFGRRIPHQVDPPEHELYQRMLAPLFTPAVARSMEDRARQIARDLLTPFAAAGGGEFIAAYARPFPKELLLPWVGLPPEGVAHLSELDLDIHRLTASGAHDDPLLVDGKAEMAAYFATLLADRRRTGPLGPDVLSYLSTAEVGGRPLEDAEIVSIMVLSFSASLHTTISSIGNIMAYLGTHADQRDALTADPALIPNAVEELMRWESLLTVRRTPTEDVTFDGQTIPAGEPIVLFLGSAGRDPERFDDPQEVDFTRRDAKRHLNFGAGVHRCAGAHIARMELKVTLEEIHRIMPTYRVDPDRPARRYTGFERGTEELWLMC